jgi:hypothetical protein
VCGVSVCGDFCAVVWGLLRTPVGTSAQSCGDFCARSAAGEAAVWGLLRSLTCKDRLGGDRRRKPVWGLLRTVWCVGTSAQPDLQQHPTRGLCVGTSAQRSLQLSAPSITVAATQEMPGRGVTDSALHCRRPRREPGGTVWCVGTSAQPDLQQHLTRGCCGSSEGVRTGARRTPRPSRPSRQSASVAPAGAPRALRGSTPTRRR